MADICNSPTELIPLRTDESFRIEYNHARFVVGLYTQVRSRVHNYYLIVVSLLVARDLNFQQSYCLNYVTNYKKILEIISQKYQSRQYPSYWFACVDNFSKALLFWFSYWFKFAFVYTEFRIIYCNRKSFQVMDTDAKTNWKMSLELLICLY